MVYVVILIVALATFSFQYARNRQQDDEIQQLISETSDLYVKIHGIKEENQQVKKRIGEHEYVFTDHDAQLKELNNSCQSNKNRIDDLHRKYLDEPNDKWENLVKAFGGKER